MQNTCLTVFTMLGLMLVVSRFQQNATNRHYELARLKMLVAMALLAVHYLLQMVFELRQSSDDIGAVVNMLFYTPVAYLIGFSMIDMVGVREHVRQYAIVGGAGCALMAVCFVMGWISYRGLDMESMQYVLHALFVVMMAYFIVVPVVQMRRNYGRIKDNTGGDIMPYQRFAWSAYIMVCAMGGVLVVAIVCRPLLYVVAPLLLISMYLYVHSFVALGYNFATVSDVIGDDPVEVAEAPATMPVTDGCDSGGCAGVADVAGECQEARGEAAGESAMPSGRIDSALAAWVKEGGYRDTSANLAKLSQQILVSRQELTDYFDSCLNVSFRVWLSDIRLREAKNMIRLHPEYSNDVISMACGFSSRSQLYRLFSDKMGMSPREWRESQCY